MIIKENRTDSYLGTVDLSDEHDMKLVKNARRIVKEANAKGFYGDKKMYIKLQGRGHRFGVRRYHQALPLKLAQTADVYIYER